MLPLLFVIIACHNSVYPHAMDRSRQLLRRCHIFQIPFLFFFRFELSKRSHLPIIKNSIRKYCKKNVLRAEDLTVSLKNFMGNLYATALNGLLGL